MKIKVVHIIKGLGRGGAEMLLLETLRLHQKELFEFHYIYFYPSKNQLAVDLVREGGKALNISATSSVGVLISFYRTWMRIKDLKPHLIHAHLPVTGFLARCIGKLVGVPVVYTEHFDLRKYRRATTWLNKLNYGWNDAVIAVSDATALAIRSEFPAIQNLITIPNGVNTSSYCRTSAGIAPNLRLIQPGRVVVGTVAVFRKQKRLDIWVDLAVAMLKLKPGFLFVLIGDGPEMQFIRSRVRESGFEDSFIFTGVVADTKSYFAGIDIFLMTSEMEGLPVALLEAMSMACAPVVTPVGGVSEVVDGTHNGLFIDTSDLAGSARAVAAFAADPARLRAVQEAARRTVEARFSVRQMVKQIEQVYCTVLERKQASNSC